MKTLVYINPDCFFDTDLSVLRHLARSFAVVWYPVYYTDRRIYYKPEELQAYASEYGIDIHLCPRKYRQRDPRNIREYLRIVKDINKKNADILYTCITEELWWILASRKLKCRKKILGLHDVRKHSLSNALKRLIQTKIQDVSIRMNDCLCVFSESQKNLFSEVYHRSAFNLRMSGKDFGPSSLCQPDIRDGVKLLFFGSISKYKGLDRLIATMESLRSTGVVNIRLTIAGTGTDWPECEKMIRTTEMYDLRVRFIDNAEIADMFATHHFLVLPYTDATQSGPLLIAANYGLPIVAPSFGCFTELYDNSSGVLYDCLEDALKRLACMMPSEYDIVHAKAGLVRQKCSEQSVAARYVNYFDSL